MWLISLRHMNQYKEIHLVLHLHDCISKAKLFQPCRPLVTASFWSQFTNGQRALSAQVVLKHKILNPTHRGIEIWKMHAIKQIKICAEYRDMLPRPRLDLLVHRTNPGSWQTKFGLGSVSRYSAQILICLTKTRSYIPFLQWKFFGQWVPCIFVVNFMAR